MGMWFDSLLVVLWDLLCCQAYEMRNLRTCNTPANRRRLRASHFSSTSTEISIWKNGRKFAGRILSVCLSTAQYLSKSSLLHTNCMSILQVTKGETQTWKCLSCRLQDLLPMLRSDLDSSPLNVSGWSLCYIIYLRSMPDILGMMLFCSVTSYPWDFPLQRMSLSGLQQKVKKLILDRVKWWRNLPLRHHQLVMDVNYVRIVVFL